VVDEALEHARREAAVLLQTEGALGTTCGEGRR
jgi:hypothetical protein